MPDTQRKKNAPDAGLAGRLADAIGRDGPVTVAAYMAAAASYYYSHAVPFGVQGDFTTAPEISQMFGEMTGAWCVDVWMQSGRPETVHLVELGPGRGTLMADILRSATAWPDFRNAAQVHLVESSRRLRAVQETALAGCGVEVFWHDDLSSVPAGFTLVVANEFFDALPVHQFIRQDGAWHERAVGHDAGKNAFFFTVLPPTVDIDGIMPPDFATAAESSVFEISPASLTVMETLSERLDRDGGAALIVDYGHAQSGLGDTLQALRRHAYADVLENPGGQDVTAHVDFAMLARAARAKSATVFGPVGQGAFLNALGIGLRAEALGKNATPEQREDIARALYRLTSSAGMGVLFKVMAIVPAKSAVVPAGFDGGDA